MSSDLKKDHEGHAVRRQVTLGDIGTVSNDPNVAAEIVRALGSPYAPKRCPVQGFIVPIASITMERTRVRVEVFVPEKVEDEQRFIDSARAMLTEVAQAAKESAYAKPPVVFGHGQFTINIDGSVDPSRVAKLVLSEFEKVAAARAKPPSAQRIVDAEEAVELARRDVVTTDEKEGRTRTQRLPAGGF